MGPRVGPNGTSSRSHSGLEPLRRTRPVRQSHSMALTPGCAIPARGGPTRPDTPSAELPDQDQDVIHDTVAIGRVHATIRAAAKRWPKSSRDRVSDVVAALACVTPDVGYHEALVLPANYVKQSPDCSVATPSAEVPFGVLSSPHRGGLWRSCSAPFRRRPRPPSLGMPSRPRDASIGTSGTVQIARGSCSMGQYAVSRLSHDLPLPEGVGLNVHRASRVWF